MHFQAREKVWPEPEHNDVAGRRRIAAAAGPVDSSRSCFVDQMLRHRGYEKQRKVDGRQIVTVISEPHRFLEAEEI